MASKVEVLDSQQPGLRIASTTLPVAGRCDTRGNPVENRILLAIPDQEFDMLYRGLHISGYYRGLIYNVDAVKDYLKSAQNFILMLISDLDKIHSNFFSTYIPQGTGYKYIIIIFLVYLTSI